MNVLADTPAPFERDKAFGIYIHFPYCERLCSYCDFVVSTNPRIPHKEYGKAILSEFAARAHRLEDHELVSIYFGGGTPSLWDPRQIEQIIKAIIKRFGDSYLREITIEANPAPSLSQNIKTLSDVGISRVSLGIQTLDDQQLKGLNRTHSRAQAIRNLEEILSYPGFQNTSADLIYGLPNSTVKSASKDAETLCEMGIKHLSLYSLALEAGTPLARSVERKQIHVPCDDEVADQAEAVWNIASQNGLNHYEVCSFATPGNEAVHNSLYWHQKPYLGLGVGAHGLEKTQQESDSHYAAWVYRENTKDLREYLKDSVNSGIEKSHNRNTWLRDLLIVRPRWLNGFHEDEIFAHTTPLEEAYIRQEIRDFLNQGILVERAQKLSLTPNSILLVDAVTERLASPVGHQTSREPIKSV